MDRKVQTEERRRGGGVQLASERGCETKLTYTALEKDATIKIPPNFIRFPKFDSRTCFLTELDKFSTMQFRKEIAFQ